LLLVSIEPPNRHEFAIRKAEEVVDVTRDRVTERDVGVLGACDLQRNCVRKSALRRQLGLHSLTEKLGAVGDLLDAHRIAGARAAFTRYGRRGARRKKQRRVAGSIRIGFRLACDDRDRRCTGRHGLRRSDRDQAHVSHVRKAIPLGLTSPTRGDEASAPRLNDSRNSTVDRE
jgi:hypothetical protein